MSASICYHIFIIENKKALQSDKKHEMMLTQIRKKYDSITKFQKQTNYFSVYISSSSNDTINLIPFADDKKKTYEIKNNEKFLDIDSITKAFESMANNNAFKGSGNISLLFDKALELIKNFLPSLQNNVESTFNRYFFLEGVDLSLEFLDPKVTYSQIMNEAKKSKIAINTEIRYSSLFCDDNGLALQFNQFGRPDILEYMVNQYSELLKKVKSSNEKKIEKFKALVGTQFNSASNPNDDVISKVLETNDECIKSDGLLAQLFMEIDEKRKEIQFLFASIKKNASRFASSTEELDIIQKSQAEFFRCNYEFDMAKIENSDKFANDIKKIREEILKIKLNSLKKEIYTGLGV